MGRQFGTKELTSCLINLGFYLDPNKSNHSHHVKYLAPKHKILSKEIRPFIVVQLGQKTYYKQAAQGYLREIRRFGFTTKDIDQGFKK